jgi:hypothetical protein
MNNLTDELEMLGDAVVWYGGEREEWLCARDVSYVWDMAELEVKKDIVLE